MCIRDSTYVSNLGMLLKAMGKLDAAEPLYRRALEDREATLGKRHPDTLISVNNLGLLLQLVPAHAQLPVADCLTHATTALCPPCRLHDALIFPWLKNSRLGRPGLMRQFARSAARSPLVPRR